jgi:hypothetical protein
MEHNPGLILTMTAHSDEISAELLCHGCGYDLRAHPQDGKCPECGASVAESWRLAAIPLRPAWIESDPRWRRRMLAGTWILVLVPLMEALKMFGWASSVPVPNVFGYGSVRALDETFLSYGSVYQSLVFCIGVVLLFSKERGRRDGRLDWMGRWGVLCSYVVLLLRAVDVLFIAAMVLGGIAAVFLSMPLKYQPELTQLFVDMSSALLRYGPFPKEISYVVCVVFSSTAILLACVPLFNALCSSGPKRIAAILIAPLALFSLMHLARVGEYFLGNSSMTGTDFYRNGAYLNSSPLIEYIAGTSVVSGWSLVAFVIEAIKWCVILVIALWLSVAQLVAWVKCRAKRQQLKPKRPVEALP